MPAFMDITGRRFGRLVALEYVGRVGWLCRCDCGKEKIVRSQYLRERRTESCGCLHNELLAKRNHKHGQATRGAVSLAWHRWAQMLQRCENPKNKKYPAYGGRGIRVCDAWHSFETYYAEVGDAPDGMSLDRMNNDGNYEPGNWRWANDSDQAYNRRQRGGRKKK